MKTISITRQKMYENPKFQRYLRKYAQKKGFQQDLDELTDDNFLSVVVGAMIAFSAIDLNIDEEFILVFEELDSEIKSVKGKKLGRYDVEIDADSLQKMLGLEDDDLHYQSMLNDTKYQRLTKNEIFIHPLSKIEKINGQEMLNNYAVATTLINAIRQKESIDDKGESARLHLSRLMLISNPTIDIETFIQKIESGDLNAMLRVATLASDGFQRFVENELENNK